MGAMSRTSLAGLEVDTSLARFVEEEALPGTGIEPDPFWQGLADLVAGFTPRIRAALARRDELQAAIDAFHRDGRGMGEYAAHLRAIGYLVDPPDEVALATTGVDPEVALTAGPQLVVPLSNPRFAANAANARWGSLYDALYGTDAIDEDDGRERTACLQPRPRRRGGPAGPRAPRRARPAGRRLARRRDGVRRRRPGSARPAGRGRGAAARP